MSFKIEANTTELKKALAGLSKKLTKLTNLKPALNQIGYYLLEVTEDAFNSETSPFGDTWDDLAPATWKQKQKKGHTKKLQNKGALAGSIDFSTTADHLIFGSNLEYAPIQQFGGNAGKNKNSYIPPRPFLPIDINGNIPNSVEKDIVEFLQKYIQK